MTRLASILSILVGLAFIVTGGVAWGLVSNQLAEENITVPDDAPWSQGEVVNGPIDAFAQAEIIKEHALAGSDGKTYAELGGLVREAEAAGDTEAAEEYQAQRNSNMNGSFLRASLFTSVLAYGVSAMAIATGLTLLLLGLALNKLASLAKRRHDRDDHYVDNRVRDERVAAVPAGTATDGVVTDGTTTYTDGDGTVRR